MAELQSHTRILEPSRPVTLGALVVGALVVGVLVVGAGVGVGVLVVGVPVMYILVVGALVVGALVVGVLVVAINVLVVAVLVILVSWLCEFRMQSDRSKPIHNKKQQLLSFSPSTTRFAQMTSLLWMARMSLIPTHPSHPSFA